MTHTLLDPAAALVAGADRVGGKAFGLAQLAGTGARVPRWVVLPVEAFAAHLRSCGGPEALTSTPLDPALRETISAHIDLERPVAVRSSALGEDGAHNSYAGVYESYLNRTGIDEVATAILQCWASVFSDRATAYREQAGQHEVGIAVVIQEMALGEVSGVVFTSNPVTGRRDHALISACWGLGEGIVGGACNTDEFVVSHTGQEVSVVVADKDTMVVAAADGGTCEAVPAPARRGVRCLDEAQVRELSVQALRVAETLGAPQDIEWTLCDGEVVLLQTRPITSAIAGAVGQWRTVWDNSNIQESFNGVTLPLTFSWAAAVYRTIFRETLRMAGVDDRTIERHEPVLRNMVGLVSGRVYYNINNWYQILQLTPQFDRNKADVEKMLGVEHPVDFIADSRVGSGEKLRRLPALIPVILGLGWRTVVRRRSNNEFQQQISAALREIEDRRRNATDLSDLLTIADDVLVLFRRWAVPMFNDFYLSRQAGRIRRMIAAAGHAHADEVVAGLLAAQEAIESLEPTLWLMRIAAAIQQEPAQLRELCSGEPLEALARLGHAAPRIAAEIDAFVDRFGDRCMGEQKLETISLRQDRTFLVKILRNYVGDLNLDPVGFEAAQRKRQRDFEAGILDTIPRRRRRRLHRALRGARDAVKARESMRLTRTRTLGLGRAVYCTVGELLCRAGHLDDPRHVFYLSMEEISAFAEGRAVTTDLVGLVALRAKEFEGYHADEPPNQFQTWGAPYGGRRGELAPPQRAHPDDRVLHGVGCCPGVVEGEVAVVLSPADDLNITGKILTTLRTDPGWGPLFPSVAGLMVERGSTLSHSAVLARELGIPAVVGIPGLLDCVTHGERVSLDGGTGTIHRLTTSPPESGPATAVSEPDSAGRLVHDLACVRLGVDAIETDRPLVDYGLDSVRAAELVADLEHRFGVEIDDEDAAALHTVDDIVAHVTELAPAGGGGPRG